MGRRGQGQGDRRPVRAYDGMSRRTVKLLHTHFDARPTIHFIINADIRTGRHLQGFRRQLIQRALLVVIEKVVQGLRDNAAAKRQH